MNKCCKCIDSCMCADKDCKCANSCKCINNNYTKILKPSDLCDVYSPVGICASDNCPPPPLFRKKYNYSVLVTIQIEVLYNFYRIVNYFPWFPSAEIKFASIYFETVIYDTPLDIQVYDYTFNEILGTMVNITASKFYQLKFKVPTTQSRLTIRVRKSFDGGINPQIFGISLITK